MSDEVVRGRAGQLLDGAFLHDTAVAHQDGPAGEECRFRQIVRDQHDGLRQPREGVPQILLQIEAGHRVERPQRLVQQQHLRIEHQGPHQAHALGLPSGELAGQAAQGVQRQARDRGQLLHARRDAPLLPAQPARDHRHVLARGKMRKEPAALHHVADLPADPRQPVARQGPSAEADLARVRPHQPVQHPQQGGLSGPARSDQRRGAALAHDQIDGAQRGRAVIPLHHRRCFEDRRHAAAT